MLTGRLQWIAHQLIEQHTLRQHTTTSNGHSNAHSSGHSRGRYSSLTEWMQSLTDPLSVLQGTVMPVVAQHPAVHSLLTDVVQTIEMLAL